MFPQESSSPGTLGPHCPVGPLAPGFSRQALTPLAVPCPKTTPGVPAPRAPMAHALRLTPRPCGDGHVFLHVLWFKLSVILLWEALGDRPCVQMCNPQENAFRPSL